ncbi:thiamine-phosphate kinase [Alkalimarinus alittae]|uniref:Thiamine-monophosphate kinase n=1 Tax=Alkalimarinus alittae TaxID=2961619 RepID=A0ABY6N0M0_9ALTE|nr:thiamine-phosphate kinase [Alkalimarinus alittae]UZE95619.1 thiamine-phosphate kinase [Alkalimarinus alittae]
MTNHSVDEFGLISRFFGNVGAFDESSFDSPVIPLGIGDDCAILRTPPGHEICLSIDTLVSGVHFPESITPYHLGYRCLAVSLSDLAAMGATPVAFTLALTLPESDPKWLSDFSQGLSELANEYQIKLIGGDTTKGPLTISIQVHGLVPAGQAIKRSGAQPGDLICVSGSLGDAGAALGFLELESTPDATTENSRHFLERYFRPQPKIALGCFLRGHATAAIDISDGLLADFSHIAKRSGVGGLLYENNIPRSVALLSEMEGQSLSLALTAGDDYELCFCMPEACYEKLKNEALFDSVSVVGVVSSECGLKMKYEDGSERVLSPKGYTHF